MPTIVAIEDEPILTFADLMAGLGNVPTDRVLMTPPPGSAAEADVVRLAERADKRLCELVDGVLVAKAGSVHSSVVAAWVGSLVLGVVDRQKMGFVTGAAGMSRMTNGNVRTPDVSFFSWGQSGGHIPDIAMMPVSPVLAVEVLAPGNTAGELSRKRDEYFASGSRVVWEFDPRTRTVRVFTSVQESVLLTEADQLTGGDVLPGFVVAVRDVFGKLDPRG